MTGYVYFLQPVGGGLIKIGWSAKPLSRLEMYMAWSPVALELIATAEAPKQAERVLHARFSAAREHHEWFRPTPEVLALAMTAKATGQLDRDYSDLTDYVVDSWYSRCLLRDLLNAHGLTTGALAEHLGKRRKDVVQWCSAYVPLKYVEPVIEFFAGHGIRIGAGDLNEPRTERQRHPAASSSEARAS